MLIARAAVIISIMFLVPSLVWLVAGMLGLLPTNHLSIGGSSGERTLASVAVASCIIAAIACFRLEKESKKWLRTQTGLSCWQWRSRSHCPGTYGSQGIATKAFSQLYGCLRYCALASTSSWWEWSGIDNEHLGYTRLCFCRIRSYANRPCIDCPWVSESLGRPVDQKRKWTVT